MALEELALIARGQKSLFPCWPSLHHLFCYHIYWCGDTQKGHLGFYVHPFMICQFYQTSLVAETVKRLSTMRETWVGKIPWRRKWQSTPGLLPGKSHGQRSPVGYSPWGRKELDTTERLHYIVLLWSGIYSGLCTAMQNTDVSPGGLSLGGILEGYSVAPGVASEEEQKSG